MEKEKEKQIVYDGLVKLTSEAEPNKYFSRKRIIEEIKKDIEEEKKIEVHYRAGYKAKYKQYLDGTWDYVGNERIDLNDVLPRQKTLASNLEELAKEGKVETITTESGGCGGFVKFYRAILGEK